MKIYNFKVIFFILLLVTGCSGLEPREDCSYGNKLEDCTKACHGNVEAFDLDDGKGYCRCRAPDQRVDY